MNIIKFTSHEALCWSFFKVYLPWLSGYFTAFTVFANSVDPDQLTSEEANWSGSALFAIKY